MYPICRDIRSDGLNHVPVQDESVSPRPSMHSGWTSTIATKRHLVMRRRQALNCLQTGHITSAIVARERRSRLASECLFPLARKLQLGNG
jgi:hypothetical protein